MKSLKSILVSLTSKNGILGSIIITRDGMTIESDLDGAKAVSGETVGAFMSHVALVIKSSFGNLGHEDFTRYTMESDKGKIYLVDLGKSFIVSLTEKNVDEGAVNIALFQAASEIKKTERFDVEL